MLQHYLFVHFVVSRMEADDDIGDLGPKEVAVRMMFAPINPSDINQVPQIDCACIALHVPFVYLLYVRMITERLHLAPVESLICNIGVVYKSIHILVYTTMTSRRTAGHPPRAYVCPYFHDLM